jgi:hypothetical protein
VEHARGDLAVLEGAADEVEAAGAVAHVQVQDAGLAGDHAGDVGVGGDAQELVEGGLGGAVVGEGELADADDRVDEDDVAADAAGEGGDRELVAAGVAVGGQALVAQAEGAGDEVGDGAGGAVGAEDADDGGDAGGGELGELDGWDAGGWVRPRRRRR